MTLPKQDITEILTTSAKKRDAQAPTFRWQNPTAQRLYVSDLLCTPGPYFNAYGALHVSIDGRSIAESTEAGAYATQQVFTVSMLNEVIAPYGYLEISAWNPSEASDDEIQVGIRFSHDTAPFSTTAQTQALAPSELRAAISAPAEGGLSQDTQALLNQLGTVNASLATVSNGIGTLSSLAEAGIDASITPATVPRLIALLGPVIDGQAAGSAVRTALTAIRTALENLRDGFDAAEATAAATAIGAQLGAAGVRAAAGATLAGRLDALRLALQEYSGRLADAAAQRAAIVAAIGAEQEALTGAIEALPQTHTDIVNAIAAAVPDAENIAALPTLLLDIAAERNKHAVGSQTRTSLSTIYNSYLGLYNGFDLAELQRVNTAVEAQLIHVRQLSIAPDIRRMNLVIQALETTPLSIEAANTAISTAIGALPQSHQDILEAVSELGIDVPHVLAHLANPNDLSADAGDRTRLAAISTAITTLLNGFDLNNLETAMATIRLNLNAMTANLNAETRREIQALLYTLERQHETAPALQSSDRSNLFPSQRYIIGAHTKLINMKGRKNLLVIFETDPAAAGFAERSLTQNLPAPFAHIDWSPFLGNISGLIDVRYYTHNRAAVITVSNARIDSPRTPSPMADLLYRRLYDIGTTTGTQVRAIVRPTAVFGSAVRADAPPYTNLYVRARPQLTANPRTYGDYVYTFFQWKYQVRVFVQMWALRTSRTGADNLLATATATYEGDANEIPTLELNARSAGRRYILINVFYTILPRLEFLPADTATGTRLVDGGPGLDRTIDNPVEAQETIDLNVGAGTLFTSTAFNAALTGGTAELSFEVSDGGNPPAWKEHISAQETGAITEGQRVISEIGAATSNHLLPSTQTGFRARLTVRNSPISTSVKALLIP